MTLAPARPDPYHLKHGLLEPVHLGHGPCVEQAVSAFRFALGVTLILLGALMLLGLNLQLGLNLRPGWQAGRNRSERSGPPRLVHHVLYFLICLGTLVTATLALLGGRTWWPLLLLLALLLGMGRTRPGRPAHWRLALLIALLYTWAACWLW